MDKKKQIIEEMAKVLDGDCGECYTCKYFEHKGTNCTYLLGAEYLYNAGYRKIHENAVVLTRGAYNKLEKKIADLSYDADFHKQQEERIVDLQYDKFELKQEISEKDNKIALLEETIECIKFNVDFIRKETAGKFAERLKEYVIDDFSEYDYGYLCMKIDGICKEITEGKI